MIQGVLDAVPQCIRHRQHEVFPERPPNRVATQRLRRDLAAAEVRLGLLSFAQHDRAELKEAMDQLEYPKGASIIARTAGIGRSAPELQWDLNYLLKLWSAIDGASKAGKGAFLIYQESSLVIRAIRDYFTADVGEILIDTDDIYDQAQQFMAHVMPEHAARVKRYRDDAPLFSRFQIEHQIETAHSRFPVFEDNRDNVIGILLAKDLLRFYSDPDDFDMRDMLRPAVFIPESKPLNVLLKPREMLAPILASVTNVTEVAVGQGRTNAVEHFSHFRGGHAASAAGDGALAIERR